MPLSGNPTLKRDHPFPMYVYLKSKSHKGLDALPIYTVGFYDPSGNWVPESDWPSAEEAANRVHFLNGGNTTLLRDHLSHKS